MVYCILRILNNNALLAEEKGDGSERILLGKGIGFGKRAGDEVTIDEGVQVLSLIHIWVVSNNEKDKALYYVKMDEKKINAMDIVEDDTNGDEDMEWFLEELEEHSIEVSENSLYCYKDGKEVEVAKKLSSDIYAQDNSDTCLLYTSGSSRNSWGNCLRTISSQHDWKI